jgi:hypothetical protein
MTHHFNKKLDHALQAHTHQEATTPWTGPMEIHPSQGDGWIITTPHGFIDYRPNPEGEINEIWWIESNKRGHGTQLIDLMQTQHPATAIAWGITSQAGKALAQSWHKKHPEIEALTGPHEGQFDPYNHDENNEENDEPI